MWGGFSRIKQALGRPGMQERGALLQGAGQAMQGGGLGAMIPALQKFRQWKSSQGKGAPGVGAAPQGGPQMQAGGAWNRQRAGFSKPFEAPQLQAPEPASPPEPPGMKPPQLPAMARGGFTGRGGQGGDFMGSFGRGYFG